MQQQKTFLQVIGEALSIGQSAGVEVQGLGEGKVRLVFTPKIGETPEGASEEVIALRAAIAAPFVVTGTPTEIEQAFAFRMSEKTAVLNRGLSALDEIERLASAAKDRATTNAKGAASAKPIPQESDEDNLAGAAVSDAGTVADATQTGSVPATSGSLATHF